MSKVISDNEMTRLWGEISKLSGKTAVDKWKLCQHVFVILKQALKDKDNALENRKAALMSSEEYGKARDNFRSAKRKLEQAEAVALDNESIKNVYDKADGMRLCRNEEAKIFQQMFDKVALACKKDPIQGQFVLFVENENDESHNRFGEYFRYTLDLEGVGRFWRGKNNKTPTEYVLEVEQSEKTCKKTCKDI